MAVDLGYTVQTQYPTVEFLGGTQTRDAVAVGITTRGHGVYLEFRVPSKSYSAETVKSYATGYTGTIESQFETPGVTGLQWSQQPTDSGQLEDVLTYTVSSDSGNSAAQFTLPLSQATPKNAGERAKHLVAELNAAEQPGE